MLAVAAPGGETSAVLDKVVTLCTGLRAEL
jgi:hypothetical protein